MVEVQQALRRAYQRAQEGALVLPHAGAGVVRLTGTDRLDFLHRLSTNSLADLPPGRHAETLLTNALGRMVDWLTVLCLPERLLLVTSVEREQSVQEWLASHIFFGDEVEAERTEGEWILWGLYGPGARAALREVFTDDEIPDGAELTRDEDRILWRTDRPVPGALLSLRGRARERASAAWGEAADLESERMAYEVLRVEAGIPQAGAEITEEVTPLEVNLGQWIDFVKGCYIGQEVIARMESRGRIPRRLHGLRLSGPVEAGTELRHQGRLVGHVTSSARSPAQGPLALALLRTRDIPPEGAPLKTVTGRTAERRTLPWPR